jgi:hypothetical protein
MVPLSSIWSRGGASRGCRWATKRSYSSVPDVVAACRPQAEALAQRWRQFGQAEPELAEELVRGGVSNPREAIAFGLTELEQLPATLAVAQLAVEVAVGFSNMVLQGGNRI